MKSLKTRKYDLIALGLILILFLISIQVRKENLKAPLSRHHEWITAHSLITAEIWDQNGGPSASGFNPVYTYKGEGNAYRRMLGGVTAENGDVYYVSYPPFSFIYLYYSSQLFGGPSLFSIRIVSLSVHLISALLLYFLLGAIRPDSEKKRMNFAGIIAAGLYIFAQGNLWFQGNLYFADMVVQPLFIAGILLAIRYLRGDHKNERVALSLLFIIFFLGAYTEWLGLLSAFFTGLLFLVYAIIKKQKKYLRPFIVIALGSSLALSLTVYQYSSIDGWDSLKSTSEKKYSERSGHGTEQDSASKFNIHNEESFEFLKTQFNRNYKALENFIGYAFGALIVMLILGRIKRVSPTSPTHELKMVVVLFSLTLLPILTHYLLFFNFNTMHDFSGLKTATFLIIIVALIIQITYRISIHINTYVSWSLLAFFSIFSIIKVIDSTDRYLENHRVDMIDFDRVNSAIIIAEYSSPEQAVFTNVRLSPEQVFYTKHSISPIKDSDSTAILNIMRLHRNTTAQYYHHEGSLLKSMVTIQRQDDNLVFLDTIVFN